MSQTCLHQGLYNPDYDIPQRYCVQCGIWFHIDCLIQNDKTRLPTCHSDPRGSIDNLTYLAKCPIRRGGTNHGPVGNGKMILKIRELSAQCANRTAEDGWKEFASSRHLSELRTKGYKVYVCSDCGHEL